MISFASLFVGLVFGIVNVELVAAAGVERVELLLDGRPVAELHEPWRAPLDLGCTPAPRELVAVAYGSGGREVGRARQWVNRPRALAEASLVVERPSGGGPAVARLSWRSLAGEAPRSIALTFDELPVVVRDPARIELPRHDAKRSHSLRASLVFADGVVAETETSVGGVRRDEASRELTAVALQPERGRRLDRVEDLAGLLERDGSPLVVSAIEGDGPMDVVFVCEGSASEPFRRVVRGGGRFVARSEVPAELRFRFLFPVGTMKTQASMVANTYPITSRLSSEGGSFAAQAAGRVVWPRWTRGGQRLADAVAVAALAAAEQERRRAVVLILGPLARDGGLLTPAEATSFLSDLGVPLLVWSIGLRTSPEAGRWPGTAKVASYGDFRTALRDLVRTLEGQRIVWVEGSHPPQAVEPSAQAVGFRRAGPGTWP